MKTGKNKNLSENFRFNEEDARLTYRLLRHKNETEIRLIDPHKKEKPFSIFVTDESKFVEKCKKYNSKYNIYVGINERKSKGTKKKGPWIWLWSCGS